MKRKIITNYEKLPIHILEMLKDGYQSSITDQIVQFNDPRDHSKHKAIMIEADGIVYLIKVNEKLAQINKPKSKEAGEERVDDEIMKAYKAERRKIQYYKQMYESQ
ncbi:MAG: hypothetical protein MRY83_07120 [Flavobacteriales bacterium]|nr:hypothetical protein [Flavobacteriales bacterium]